MKDNSFQTINYHYYIIKCIFVLQTNIEDQ